MTPQCIGIEAFFRGRSYYYFNRRIYTMLVTFPDGSQRNYEDTATALDIANSISPRLGKATLAC